MAQVPATHHRWQDVARPRLMCDCTLDGALGSILPQPPTSYAPSPPAVADLGSLGKLPLEVLEIILPKLDLRTLTNILYVNRCAADVVRHLPQFSLLAKYARNVMRGALAIETARYVTCGQLLEQLHTSRCTSCEEFGGYLFLLTFERVCFPCFAHKPMFRPVTPNYARRRFGLDDKALEEVPRMRYVPGAYGVEEVQLEERGEMVDYGAAYKAGIKLHGSVGAMSSYAKGSAGANGWGATFRKWLNLGFQPRMGVALEDSGSTNPYRFVAICQVPWMDRVSDEVEWGFQCSSCQDLETPDQWTWWELFTVETHKRHIC